MLLLINHVMIIYILVCFIDSPVMIENEDLIPIIEEGSLSPAECDQFSDEVRGYYQSSSKDSSCFVWEINKNIRLM